MRWRSWLRHCATSKKIADLIREGVIWIFHWCIPSRCSLALGLTACNRNEGGKGSWWVGLTTLPTSCAHCLEILVALTSWSREVLSGPVMEWLLATIKWVLPGTQLYSLTFFCHRMCLLLSCRWRQQVSSLYCIGKCVSITLPWWLFLTYAPISVHCTRRQMHNNYTVSVSGVFGKHSHLGTLARYFRGHCGGFPTVCTIGHLTHWGWGHLNCLNARSWGFLTILTL